MRGVLLLFVSLAVGNAIQIKYPVIPPITNPGKCPDLSGIITTCEFDPSTWGCFDDSQCGKGMKCCRYGCGRKDCHVAVPFKELAPVTAVPASPCSQAKDIGKCPRSKLWWNFRIKMRWYYNKSTNGCEVFFYSGCKGNGNNFRNERECINTCKSFAT